MQFHALACARPPHLTPPVHTQLSGAGTGGNMSMEGTLPNFNPDLLANNPHQLETELSAAAVQEFFSWC